MKTTILKAAVIIIMAIDLVSCSKAPQGVWVQTSTYHEYVILNNGDTVTYSDGFNMPGVTTGGTYRQLSSEEQQALLSHLDSSCLQSVKGREPYVDKAIKWKRNFAGQSLSYMMNFGTHKVDPAFSNMKVEDIKTVAIKYVSTYQRYSEGQYDKGFMYDIFQ